ncbi:MAG: ABC transporter permease [Clostridium beijerinckii]|jgi:putative ABC transport system permease protein|nr:ABC transporter permease [Clostridium beijerinckii]MCI1581554.1 ABC transporter permease [Clostridium beijerinckii]MCI1585947.1 ABC transporter permease [Clostridium beijerinckii]MCI1625099.1 ABC transporter permease [Clostridium beijerinckii]
MINNYLQITSRYLKSQKKRTTMTVIGIVLSTALIAAVGTLGLSIWSKMYKDTMKKDGAYEVAISYNSKEEAEKIKNHVLVKDGGTIVQLGKGGKSLIDNEKGILTEKKEFDPNGYDICAYDDKALEMWPFTLIDGRMPKSSDEIIIGNETLPYLKEKIKLGDAISIDMLNNKSKTYTVVGFMDSNINFSRRMEGITLYDSNLTYENATYKTYVNFKNNSNIHKQTNELLDDLDNVGQNSFKVFYNEDVLRFLLQSNNNGINIALILGCVFLGIIVVVAMSAVIYNIFNIAILERISQFGLLRCIGATDRQIRKLVFKEAAIFSFIGIPLGIIFGTFAIKILIYILAILVPNLPYGNLKLIISPYIIIISVVLSLICIYISAFGPAIKAGKVFPLDAIRNLGSLRSEKFKNISSGKFVRRFLGAEGWMARKNLGRNRKRFVITVGSMVISIVLLIVFNSLIDLTYKTGIDDSDNGTFEFQISHKDNRGDVKLSEDDYKALSGLSGVSEIYSMYYRYFDTKQKDSTGDEAIVSDSIVSPKLKTFDMDWYNSKKISEGYVDFDKSQIVGLSKENLADINKYLLEGEIKPDKMDSEKGVVIVNTGNSYNLKTNKHIITDYLNVKVGDTIRLRIPNNENNQVNSIDEYKEYKVLGILKQGIWGQKFNCNGGINVYTTEDIYRELTKKDRNPDYLMIKLKDNADLTSVRNFLNSMIKKYPSLLLRDREVEMNELKQYNLVIDIFVYGFFIVIAAISCVNIFNTISANIMLRTRELLILKAIGMTKQESNKLIRLECVFYSIAAIIVGNTLGVLCSFMLYKMLYSAVVIDWNIPWSAVFMASTGTVVVAIIASHFPLKRINKTVIVEGINNVE